MSVSCERQLKFCSRHIFDRFRNVLATFQRGLSNSAFGTLQSLSNNKAGAKRNRATTLLTLY